MRSGRGGKKESVWCGGGGYCVIFGVSVEEVERREVMWCGSGGKGENCVVWERWRRMEVIAWADGWFESVEAGGVGCAGGGGGEGGRGWRKGRAGGGKWWRPSTPAYPLPRQRGAELTASPLLASSESPTLI